MAPLVQERVATLGEVPAMVDFLFLADPPRDEAAIDKALVRDANAGRILAAAAETYGSCDFDAAGLHRATIGIGEGLELNLRKTQAPIRVAVTGRSRGGGAHRAGGGGAPPPARRFLPAAPLVG